MDSSSDSGPTTYEDWLDALEVVLGDPSQLQSRCPNCGVPELRLIFDRVDVKSGIGMVAFWCDHCLVGVLMGRSDSRAGFDIRYQGQTYPEGIPDFRVPRPTV